MCGFSSVGQRIPRLGLVRRVAVACVLLAVCAHAAADAVRVTAYDIHVRLNPGAHTLRGQTKVTLRTDEPRETGDQTATVEFALNRTLKIERLIGEGASVREHTRKEPPATQPGQEPDTRSLLTIHRLVLDATAAEFTLSFDYAGELVQDVQAGERPGQIHNFLMAAHIGTEGIYLDGSGGWYPFIYRDPDDRSPATLANYRLIVDPVAGMRLVAGATFDGKVSEQSGKLTWRSKYPLDSLVLVGGTHQVKEKQVGPIHLALHYTPPKDPESRETIEKNTDLFLAAAAEYLGRYPSLIGRFPFEHFTIVENFFSSGFAFPEFTLLNKTLWQMGPRALGHGYLDHEMLHAWWGNSIYVDPRDGNWCEALASYAANYYGYILDGDEKGARNQRRNCCITVNAVKPEDDKPLGTFGRKDGPGRDVGYSKGAMVFHMLARKIGQDHFWTALRRLTDEYTGKYADWRTLQTLFEEQSGQKLDRFVAEWVRSAGAPHLEPQDARWSAADRMLELTLSQEGTAFELAVPLRVLHDDGTHSDHPVALDQARVTVRLPLDKPPKSVLLDPDYHVLRKLEPREIMPTTKITTADRKLLVVTPGQEVPKFYQRVIEAFRGDDQSKTVTQRTAQDVTADDLAHQSVLILGDAVRSAPVQALLKKTDCPIVWAQSGFRVGDAEYAAAGHAVLCTVHHPDVSGAGLTVYYGNSEDALGRSDLLLFYRNSLVVFETAPKEVEGQPTYESRVLVRRDFETQPALEVRK